MQMRVKLNQLSWGEVIIIRGLIDVQISSLLKIKESWREYASRACQEEGVDEVVFYNNLENKLVVLNDIKDNPKYLFSLLNATDISTLRHILTHKNKEYQKEYPEALKSIKVKFSTFRGLIQTVNLN